jgi:similar to stage IV sporulation protein
VVVEEGQAVLKGETLISGTEEHVSGDGTERVLSVTQVRAEGRVKALTRRTLRCATPLAVSAREATGEKKRLAGLRAGRRSMKIGRESSFFTQRCARIEKTYHLTLPGGRTLPIALEQTELMEYRLRPARLRRESAEKFLRSRLEEQLTALVGEEGQVLSRDLDFREKNGVLFATLTASCVEDIAVMVPGDAQPAQDVNPRADEDNADP